MDYSKKCPDCAEDVKADARVCRFCAYRFEDPSDLSGRPASGERNQRQSASYALAIGAWIAGVVPLAVGLLEDGGTEDVVISAIAAVSVTIGFATLLRGGYVLIRKRPFASPWLFVMAAALAYLAAAGTLTDDTEDADSSRATYQRGTHELADL